MGLRVPAITPRADVCARAMSSVGTTLNVVLATSGLPHHTQRALEALGLSEDDYPMATSDDASQTKPAPDLLMAAIEQADAVTAIVVGDSV